MKKIRQAFSCLNLKPDRLLTGEPGAQTRGANSAVPSSRLRTRTDGLPSPQRSARLTAAKTPDLQSLPHDVLVQIVTRLPPDKRKQLRGISRTKLAGDGADLYSPALRNAINETVRAAHVVIERPGDLAAVVAAFKAGGLDRLKISRASNLRDAPLDLSSLAELDLKQLDLREVNGLQDAQLAPLAACGALHYLDLRGTTQISGEGLAGLTQLKSLNLTKCSGLTEAGLATGLQKMAGLAQLNISYCNTLSGACLASLTGLQTLSATSCTRLTDTSFGLATQQMPQLTQLAIDKCPQLTGHCLAGLRGLKILTAIACPGLSDDGLAHGMKTLTGLLQLKLGDATNFTGRGLAGLSTLRTLQLLRCFNLNDAGLQIGIENMRDLTSLKLTHAYRLTGEFLRPAPQLQALNFQGCTGLNESILTARTAQDQMPNLTRISLLSSVMPSAAWQAALSERGINLQHRFFED